MLDSLTFQALFELIQLSSASNSGHSVTLTVSVLPSAKGEWKEVELDADVSLSVSFGYHYVWLNLAVSQFIAAGCRASMPFISFQCAACECGKARCVAWTAKIISPKINFFSDQPKFF